VRDIALWLYGENITIILLPIITQSEYTT